MVEPTEAQFRGDEPFNYIVIFNYHSMNHGELVIAFSLDWPVYFILYLVVGLFSIVELIIFYIYHFIANKDFRPSFAFFSYFIPLYPAMFKGLMI